MVVWTAERIAELSIEGVKNLRENARRLANSTVVDLCDADIARRAPTRTKLPRVKVASESRHGQVVGRVSFCLWQRQRSWE